MYDIEIHMANNPGELARMGTALSEANISVEGGGMWLVGGVGVAHFLIEDGTAARDALAAAGMSVAGCRQVLLQRLNQDEPGQLGKFCQAMADAGVNIELLYSDHDHQLVVAVDDHDAGQMVSDTWTDSRNAHHGPGAS
jgi:hypothetical protein